MATAATGSIPTWTRYTTDPLALTDLVPTINVSDTSESDNGSSYAATIKEIMMTMAGAGNSGFAIPEWFSGTTTEKIQAAIDSLQTTGGTVVLMDMYTVSGRTSMTMISGAPACDTILVPRSGVNIIGLGYNTGIKVADGMVSGGDYVVFGPESAEAINNVTFSNFRIDGNGDNNLHPGGSAIRREIAIWLYGNDGVSIEGLWFENNPGSNTIKLGNDNVSYEVNNARIVGNRFALQGGGISGNRGQSDHSTIYISGNNVLVSGNTMLGASTVYDEDASPVAVLAAIEMHGSHHRIIDNHVENYGSIGYSVSDYTYQSDDHVWRGNKGVSISKVGISLWSPQVLSNVVIDSNIIEVDHTLDQAVAGIFQSYYAPDTTAGISNFKMINNIIKTNGSTYATTWHGAFFTALDGADIIGNTFDTISESGVFLSNHGTLATNMKDVSLRNNTYKDCNIKTAGYGLKVANNGTGDFDGISIVGEKFVNSLARTRVTGGVLVEGSGKIKNVEIGADCIFKELPDPSLWVSVNPTFAASGDVKVQRRSTIITAGALPPKGIYILPYDGFTYWNPSSGYVGAVVATAGAGYSATRANSTAYAKGVWVRTTAGLVLECIVAGTSGTGDPSPTTLGSSVTDGTVTWIYRSATALTTLTY